MMTKAESLQIAQKYGAEFVAHVIDTQHRNPAAKLRGLAELLEAGHEVRTGQFSIDTLVIDGRGYGWEVLESPGVLKHSARFAALDEAGR